MAFTLCLVSVRDARCVPSVILESVDRMSMSFDVGTSPLGPGHLVLHPTGYASLVLE